MKKIAFVLLIGICGLLLSLLGCKNKEPKPEPSVFDSRESVVVDSKPVKEEVEEDDDGCFDYQVWVGSTYLPLSSDKVSDAKLSNGIIIIELKDGRTLYTNQVIETSVKCK